jgi:hypothetical protein
MSKISAIQQQLDRTTGRATLTPTPAEADKPPPVVRYKAPSRQGKTHIGAYLHPDFKRSLRMVQAQTGKDIQALIAQALNDLFRAHNVTVIDNM